MFTLLRLPLPSKVLKVCMKGSRRNWLYQGSTTSLDMAFLSTFVPAGYRGICALYKRYAGLKGLTEPLAPVLAEIIQGDPILWGRWERMVREDLADVVVPRSTTCLLRMWRIWLMRALHDILAYVESRKRVLPGNVAASSTASVVAIWIPLVRTTNFVLFRHIIPYLSSSIAVHHWPSWTNYSLIFLCGLVQFSFLSTRLTGVSSYLFFIFPVLKIDWNFHEKIRKSI